ncbi:uncharacterized protein LAESUDRAFT_652256, partial [Laetiporus sulphureus 93-53]
FPIYRAQSRLHTDPDTGRMYLTDGYTNSSLVPSGGHETIRSFEDLCQLRVDVPGDFFEEVNLEDEMRSTRMGPWQKCFTCGNAEPWKKCGRKCG